MKPINRIADITLKSILSSGFAIGLAILSLASSSAKASDWRNDINYEGIDSFNNHYVTPIISFEVSASPDVWNNDSFDISASYTGIRFTPDKNVLSYRKFSTAFHVSSPLKHLDFSDEIRKSSELCPEKILRNMIIDGAVSFNLNW